jgi:pimeloyl-ACP methyl ester carboxylesterase
MTSIPLHIEDAGDGDPVVLLHSSGLSGRQWRRLASELMRRGFRAIVPDLTGHGASDAWPEAKPFSFQVDVDHMVALLRRLERPAHLVGHSYGGFVALLAAKAAPERVRELVLYDPVAFGTLEPTADADAMEDLARIDFLWDPSEAGRERFLRQFADYWGGDGAWASLREEARAELRRVAWVVHEGARTLSEDRTPASAYRDIGRPVRLINGERSPLAARRVVERLLASLPDTTVVIAPNAGHLAPLTDADLINGFILSALSNHVHPGD